MIPVRLPGSGFPKPGPLWSWGANHAALPVGIFQVFRVCRRIICAPHLGFVTRSKGEASMSWIQEVGCGAPWIVSSYCLHKLLEKEGILMHFPKWPQKYHGNSKKNNFAVDVVLNMFKGITMPRRSCYLLDDVLVYRNRLGIRCFFQGVKCLEVPFVSGWWIFLCSE